MMHQSDEQLLQQAIEWMVLLTADDAETQQHAQQQWKLWKQQSLQHQKIAEQLEQSFQPVQQLTTDHHQQKLAVQVIKADLKTSRKMQAIKLGSAFAIIFASSVTLYNYFSIYSMGYLVADLKTKQGEWHKTRLSDGSEIILRSTSAVNLKFDAQQRVVELVQGEIYVDVAKDQSRPFLVKTEQGTIRALGTAFSVAKNQPEYTTLDMLHSIVEVKSANFDPSQSTLSKFPQKMQVQAGFAVQLYADRIMPLQTVNIEKVMQKWQQHQLSVENQPLNQVLQQLNQDYRGKIFYSRDLNNIQVNAVLPLDNTQEALKLLSTALPELKIVQITPYIIYVSKK